MTWYDKGGGGSVVEQAILLEIVRSLRCGITKTAEELVFGSIVTADDWLAWL
jgi:hypothetical protein